MIRATTVGEVSVDLDPFWIGVGALVFVVIDVIAILLYVRHRRRAGAPILP